MSQSFEDFQRDQEQIENNYVSKEAFLAAGEKFNKKLEAKGSVIRLEREHASSYAFNIGLPKDEYLNPEYQTVNPNDLFYDDLNEFMAEEGIEIVYNNSRRSFWPRRARFAV